MEYLRLEITVWLDLMQDTNISVERTGDALRYRRTNGFSPRTDPNAVEKTVSARANPEWLDELGRLAIYSWPESFEALVMDGESWRLCYKERGRPEKVVEGRNAYPDEWPRLLKLLEPDALK